ncbi:hypothetical protein ABPG72_001185 [Tetrahymena utriculariae]
MTSYGLSQKDFDDQVDITQERRRVEQFWNKRKENSKYVPIESLNIGDSNHTRSYCLQIEELDKIQHQITQSQQQPVERLLVKIFIHLCYKKEKKVFGNTYNTVGLELIETQKQSYKLSEKNRPSIYFHTSIQPTDQVYAIFDFQIHEMGAKEISLNQKQVGIAELDLAKEGQTQLQVRRMAFAQYFNEPDMSQAQDLGIKFVISLTPSQQFEKAKHLIPQMFLVDNMQHEIEGLELDQETNKPHLPPFDAPIQLKQSFTIILKQIEIHLPEAIETEILKNAQQNLMITNSSGQVADPASQMKNIDKQGYKLSCCYHNSRTCVNRGGINNKLVLLDSGRVEREEDNKKVPYKILKYDGAMEIDNVFASKNAMVVLQLEFKVILNTSQSRMDKDFIIGFLPIYVSDKFGLSGFKLSEPLMTQGSKSIDLKSMIKYSVKYPIYLLTRIDLSQAVGGFSPRESMVSDKPSQRKMGKNQSQASLAGIQSQEGGHDTATVSEDKNNEILKRTSKLQEIMRENQEKEKELEDFQNQLNQIQQKGPTNPGVGAQPGPRVEYSQNRVPMTNTKEFQDIVQTYESKISDLQRTIAQLRQDNEQSKQEALKEFQEIKNLIGEIKRPRTGYNTFQDPFAQERAQNEVVITNEDDKRRWEILETLVTVPKMKSNYKNQQAFTLKPQSGAEEVSNVDKVYLVNKGVRGLLDDTVQVGGEDDFIDDVNLVNEYKDQFQASLFSIKLVAFKAQISNFEDRDQVKRDSIFSENYYVPEKMYFTFNFFEFEEVQTEPYSYQDAGQITAMKKILTDNKPIVLETTSYLFNKIGPQQKSYNFSIDPSRFYPLVHKNFVDYLFRKSIHVDIWDADNLFLYGSVKIPLRSLLRRQRSSVEKQLTVPIIDSDFTRERGKLIVFLTNKGFEPSVQEINQIMPLNRTLQSTQGAGGFYKSQNNFNQTGMSNISNLNSTVGHKKKVKSYDPISFEMAAKESQLQTTLKSNFEFANDPESRQRERIRRFKIKNLQNEKGEDADIARYISKQEEQLKKIHDVQVLKEVKKGNYIKNVLSQLLSQEYIADVQFGTTQYIYHTVVNTGYDTENFQIRIDDPDLIWLGINELNPVVQPEEWKMILEAEDIQGPKDTNIIEKERMSFLLEKGQSITLIFRFLSYREIDPQLQQVVNLEEYLRSQHIEYHKKFINERIINISISSSGSISENQGFKLRVRPHRQVVDHVFRYYERGNKQVQLILPALYSQGYYSEASIQQKPSLQCTNENVLFEWLGDNEISLQMRVPSVQKITRFNLLAYRDTFFKDLLANWEIEIHSLEGVDIKIDMGLSKKTNLTLDSDGTRLVRFYSSHPLCAWFEKPFDQPCTVSKGKVNLVGLTMRSFSLMRQKVQVNCVDQSTRELLYSWLVRIETDKPVVSKMYDLKIPVNKESHIQKFSYQNRSGTESTFFIESSQIDILQIVEPKIFLGIGEKTQIKIRIARQEQPGIAEVFVFITNTDEKMECILFKLHFTVNK